MKRSIVLGLLLAGALVYADAALARNGGAGAAGGEPGGNVAGPGAAGGPGTAGDNSTTTTGTGDGLGGVPSGASQIPEIYRGNASRWSIESEYPSASPRAAIVAPPSGVIVAPPAGVVVTPPAAPGVVVTPPAAVVTPPAGPLMCPNVNPTDPRKC
jgi:hypothetical protein